MYTLKKRISKQTKMIIGLKKIKNAKRTKSRKCVLHVFNNFLAHVQGLEKKFSV
jgi:hypothetical protein